MSTVQRFTADTPTDYELTDKEKEAEAKAQAAKLRIAGSCLAAYFIIGLLAFAIPGSFEEYSFTDCMYFLMVTLTTVGYGDLSPTTQGGRLFHSFFILFAISIVAVALVEVASYVIEKQEIMFKKTQSDVVRNAVESVKKGTSLTDPMGGGGGSSDGRRKSITAGVSQTGWGRKITVFMENYPVVPAVLKLFLFSIVFGQIFCWIEGWTLLDGVYFILITGTTVGYGDVTPVTPGGRWLCFAFLPLAVVFVSSQLSQLATSLLGKGEDSKLLGLLSVDMSLDALLAMDTDGDEEITEFEFMKFMMTTVGLVDEDTLDSLHRRFQAMDTEGNGQITKNDLEELARRKKAEEDALQVDNVPGSEDLDLRNQKKKQNSGIFS